ncbi:MAG: hypothetical protein CMI53_03820 [Parcubacteria group bacterium]|nr:hypothetical protein [Parcubacteria group bacterium]
MNNHVSVIVPVYNGASTLVRCLESLASQTYSNYEVIVVDNNSTDKSKDIINSYENRNKKFRYIFESKKSRGNARNTGIKNAKGEILLFTDADCIVPNDWIGVLIRTINQGAHAATGGSVDLVNNYWTKNVQFFDSKFNKKLTSNGLIDHVDTKNFAIKSELIKGLMFDGSLGAMEDFEFYLRLKKKNIAINFLSEVEVGHHHNSSFSKVIKLNFIRGFWVAKIYQKHHKNLHQKELMFTTISVINFISAPLWYVVQLATSPRRFPYIISSDLAWRLGIIWAQIVK